MDGFLAFSQRLQALLQSVLGSIAAVMMLILTLFALLEIVRRYIFGLAFEWGQDAVIVGMVSAVAIYFGVTQVRRGHLVMGAIVQVLHSRGHYMAMGIARILVSAVIVAFCGAIGVTGWPTLTIRRGEVLYRDGEVSGTPGSGELLRRERWRRPDL